MAIQATGYAADSPHSHLKPLHFERDDPGANDVQVEVLYCGVCHSDIHQVENDWGNSVYPCMPGHEIIGRVTKAGSAVTRHKVGDLVGIGCMVDSCRQCASCEEHVEQYCEGPNSFLATYNGPMLAAKQADGVNVYGRDNTYGGYSDVMVVKEDFVLKVPANLPVQAAAPILCAGVTTYSPMKHWGVKPGSKVGVVGFGGLGDMAVKIAKALGAEVTVFTTTKEKLEEAASLGVQGVFETDADALEKLEKSFDFILSTIPQKHKVETFIPLLKRDGAYVAVGALAEIPGYNNQELILGRRQLAGSLIGSIAETQEVLDLCAEHGIAPEVEVISIKDVNAAFKKVKSGDVRFRYVIDMASLKERASPAGAPSLRRGGEGGA